MKKDTSKRLTREHPAELKSLAALPDSAIEGARFELDQK
jgi:hypothetical protein